MRMIQGFGNTISSTKNKSEINKGVFTTCKKRDNCPPWELKVEKIIRDKNKKIINYKNAWLRFTIDQFFTFLDFSSRSISKKTIRFLIPNLFDSQIPAPLYCPIF